MDDEPEWLRCGGDASGGKQQQQQQKTFQRRPRRKREIESEDCDVGCDEKSDQVSSSIAALKKSKRAFAPNPKGRQYFLDFGQSDFSFTTCNVCGLMHAPGQEDDKKVHAVFHKNFLRGVQFQGWRNERVAAALENGCRIILVLPGDPAQHQKKVKEVASVMEKDMGLAPDWLIHSVCKVFLYVASRRLVGCAIVEPVTTAFPVIPSEGSLRFCEQKKECTKKKEMFFGNIKLVREVQRKPKASCVTADFGKSVTCSTDAVPAVCGVRAIWVTHSARRTGVASTLLDTARKTFSSEYQVSISELAFSQPTAEGLAFASSYCKTDEFLVYS